MKITRLEIETANRLLRKIVEDKMAAYAKRNPFVKDLTEKERSAILRKDKHFFEYIIEQAAKNDQDRYRINISTIDGSPALKDAVSLINKRNRELSDDAKAVKDRLLSIGCGLIDDCILSGFSVTQMTQAIKSRMEQEQ